MTNWTCKGPWILPACSSSTALKRQVERLDLRLDPEPPVPDQPLALDRITWEYIQRRFQQCGRNVSRTARHLNMHRRTLQRMLSKRAPLPRCYQIG